MTDTDWTAEVEEHASDEPQLAFASLPEFVDGFLLLVAVRRPSVAHWCPQWWDHEEAVLRLEALWDAFEALRVEPGTGTAVWIRDYLDPTMDRLTSPETSPFRACRAREGKHVVDEPLTSIPPPPGMFRSTPGP